MSRRFCCFAVIALLACVSWRFSHADEIGVSSADEIANVLKTAKPGDQPANAGIRRVSAVRRARAVRRRSWRTSGPPKPIRRAPALFR